MPRRSIHVDAAARCREGSTSPRGPSGSSRDSVRLSATLRPRASPSPARSSLSMPSPWRHRSRGPARPLWAATVIRPLSHRLEPEDRAQQPRAAGTQESGNSDDFAATQRKRRCTGHHAVELQDRRRPASATLRGYRTSTLRPTISATMSSLAASAVTPCPAFRPSRRTTKRSETSFTSSMKCEM